MSLPYDRNTIYAPGSQVLSEDLNDLQDQIIQHRAIHEATLHVSPMIGYSVVAGWSIADGGLLSPSYPQSTTDGAVWIFAPQLQRGSVITQVDFLVIGNPSSTVTCSVMTATGKLPSTVDSLQSGTSGAPESLEIPLGTEFEITEGAWVEFYCKCDGGGNGVRSLILAEVHLTQPATQLVS